MKTDMGEYIVGAYLKVVKECDFVDYNVRPSCGGLEGLKEIDVIGLGFKSKTAYLCEVTTHIKGLLIKDNKTTVETIRKKYERLREYANRYLLDFPSRHFMFWSPVVPRGYLTEELEKIENLELVINEKYTELVEELKQRASEMTNDTGNPFFRFLQIIGHLRGFRRL